MPMTFRKIRIIPCFLIGILVAGCSIQDNQPDFQYPSKIDGSDHSWPKLAITKNLLDSGEQVVENAAQKQAETEQLAKRAAALRARANRLKRRSAS